MFTDPHRMHHILSAITSVITVTPNLLSHTLE